MLRKFIIYCTPIVVVLAMFGAPAFAGVTVTYSPIQHSWPVIPGTQLQIPLYPDPNVPEGPAGSPNEKVLEAIGYNANHATMQTFFVPEDSNGFTLTDLVMTAVGAGTDLNPYATLHLFDINHEGPNAIAFEGTGYIPAYDALPPSYDWFSTNCRFIYERDTNAPSPDKFIQFTFSDYEKVQLEPGHVYGLEIWPTRGVSSNFSLIRGATGTVANPYPYGQARYVDDTVGQYENLYQYRHGVGGSPRDMVLGVYGVPHDGNAYHPWPRDYEPAAPPGPNNVLTWKPGADVNTPPDGDKGHQIYFSVNYSFVNNRAGGSALKKARVTDPNWIPVEVNGAPINLAFTTTYYWRVDEYNDAIKGETGYWGGPVWQFTTAGTYARNPTPLSGTTVDFSIDPNSLRLTWTAGQTVNDVNGHRIYFGTNYTAVSDANTDTSIIFRGVRSSPVYSLLDLYPDYKLTSGTTYYWRVDEVEADDVTVWKGDVWNFVMPNPAYLNVDKFSYASQAALDAVWKTGYPAPDLPGEPEPGEYNVSGTVSVVGGQLRFVYDNRSEITLMVPWSEAKLDYNGVTSDWLANGVFDACVIGVSCSGTATSSTAADANYDRLYMALEDISGNIGLVTHWDPYAQMRQVSITYITQWWEVYLSDLTEPSNVSLSDVNAFYLGFGLRNSWSGYGKTSASTGTMNFSNLRIYTAHCVARSIALEGDFVGPRLPSTNRFTPRDCQVDINDMFYLAADWLYTEADLNYPSAVDPNIAGGLRLWYKFDEGSDTSSALLADSSGNGYEGTIGNLSPLAWIYTGHDGTGSCLNFEYGTRAWVDVPAAAYDQGADGVTFAMWTDFDIRFEPQQFAPPFALFEGTTLRTEAHIPTQFPNPGFPDGAWGPLATWNDTRTGGVQLGTNPRRFSNFGGRWNHWAFVYDDTANAMRMYYNGQLIANNEPNATLPIWSGITVFHLSGRDSGATWGFWSGKMDDFMMYNRALSENEIQWLATDGTKYRNMQSLNREPDELNDDNRINFKDFADFADAWLDQQFWP